MSTGQAKIEASLTGSEQVAAEAQKIGGSLAGVADKIQKGVGGAVRSAGSALGTLVSDGLRAAGVLQTINLANAVEDAKRLDATTARLGQSAGVAGSALKATFTSAEQRTLTAASAQADFARALARSTYDAKSSTAAVAGLADEALATGRTLDEQLALGEALRTGLGVVGDTTGELDRLRAMAERVSTIGGPTAFKDTLASLSPLLSGVVTDTDQARGKIEALVAVLGKGLKPQQAQQVGAAALSTIRSRALDIERATGRRVLDDNNQLIDPTQNLKDLKRIADRRFGKNDAAKRRALMADFGAELGLAIYRTDLGEVDRVAQARGSGKTAAEADKFRQSTEGKRMGAQLAKDAAMRSAGEQALGIHDALVENLGVPGALGLELVGGKLALKAGGLLGSKTLAGGSALVGGGVGASLGTAALVGAGGLLAAGAVLTDIGEDRDKMGARYLSEHADITGQGLANRALREGDIHGAIRASHGDAEVQRATLLALEKLLAATTEGNALLRDQVAAGIAAEFRRVPIFVTQAPADPNAPKGN